MEFLTEFQTLSIINQIFHTLQVTFLSVIQNHTTFNGIIQLSVAYVGPLYPLTKKTLIIPLSMILND